MAPITCLDAIALALWGAVDTDCSIRKVSTTLTISDIRGKHWTVPVIHSINNTGHAGYSTVIVPGYVNVNEDDVILRLGQCQMDMGSSFGNAKPSFGAIDRGSSDPAVPDALCRLHQSTFRFRYQRARLEPDGPEEIVVSAERVPGPIIAEAIQLMARINETRMAQPGLNGRPAP
ncbi:uncharacterized protein BO66DRAFT_438608 [Aspergillus aculeatinus CBS 121060]|uniref:Uncharacterized protein n=1 Tax=Aspergillus aculeatinus CBS 121060 TaxID=1448322 RepID=A0ACD1H824_9EURO|nr:hypothetical protein BO66DRAFT_438608 [Aspergillus aculeatinus CBS 121060]RAH69905.1 hypothetical protein BO66DRAFT_438608 [Aspergillus aculeatinus CBS 121060]